MSMILSNSAWGQALFSAIAIITSTKYSLFSVLSQNVAWLCRNSAHCARMSLAGTIEWAQVEAIQSTGCLCLMLMTSNESRIKSRSYQRLHR